MGSRKKSGSRSTGTKPVRLTVDSGAAFGREVRRRRELARMTLDDLAIRSGLSPNYIGSVETGKRDPSLSTMKALAKALGSHLGAILGGVRDLSPKAIEMARAFEQTSEELRQGLLAVLRGASRDM